MLQRILDFEEKPRYLDATDALAVAVCHHFQSRPLLPGNSGKVKDWKDFIEKNPGMVRAKAATR